MSRIALLSEHVASQVAAGEVVERPASVVKELVENSVDAGATRVEVLIRGGGSSLILVTDNGHGMDRDDALLCLERHATSKIRTGDDLARIATLGFRGEALPSIASVSRFRLTTREPGAIAGTEVVINGGKIDSVRDSGEAPGTQIEVRHLFYNLPARRKFLRTENTEASHVEHVLQLQAIGHPGVGFVLVRDEQIVFQLPPGQTLGERLRDLFGAEFMKEMLELSDFEHAGLTLRGFLGKAGVSRSTRQQMIVFVNGRPVENAALTHGLREGYHTALMKGQHPICFLFLEMDPAAVDVNVHPAKREVRFRDPAGVREALVSAVRATLESDRAAWSQQFRAAPTPALGLPFLPRVPTAAVPPSPPKPAGGEEPSPFTLTAPPDPAADEAPLLPLAAVPAAPSTKPAPPSASDGFSSPGFRIIGVLGRLYILMENESGLVLVDQHAAHERILFEEMQRRMESQGVPTQRLLIPVTLNLPPRDAEWVERHIDVLERAGLLLEIFGPGTFKLDAVPTFLRTSDPSQLIRDIIDELRETSTQTSRLRLGEEMIAKTVCRHAIKANDYLRQPELVRLIQDLLACQLPYCCPHGRPTMIQMSYYELEKKFGRKV